MKIAVFYYSQTGQTKQVSKHLFSSIDTNKVIYKSIEPMHQYSFPWDKFNFFDVFPETRLGITLSAIKKIDFSDIIDADLVVIFGQPWFLSPSQPIQSFFTDDSVKKYLYGRKVVFVNVCRNMWLMTFKKVRDYVNEANAQMVGHIVFQDLHSNLISVLTIIRWLMFGKKKASMMLPFAGVSDESVQNSSRFGQIIAQSLQDQRLDLLQKDLFDAGSINYKPSILYLENIGYQIFGFWARFIRCKGDFGDNRRHLRLEMFFYYLLFVLFIVSPFVQLFFYLTYPFRRIDCQQWSKI